MKNLLLLFSFFLWQFANADTGIYGSFVIADVGQGGVTYYDCLGNTSNPDFENLGNFKAGMSLMLKGAEIKTWKNGSGNITGAFMYYRVYKAGESPLHFTEIPLAWVEDGTDGNPTNQKWAETSKNINLLSGLGIGSYVIEVYFKATTNEGDKYDSNNSANYKATFEIIEGKTILNGKVTVIPEKPSRTEPVTITLDASGTALSTATQVYLHSGVGTDKPNSYAFDHTIGNWGADDGIGKMTSLGNNKWQIILSSIDDYYKLTSEDDAFALNFLFRSADGTQKEDNNGQNYHLNIDAGNYFLVQKPNVSPFLTQSGQTFEIKAEANRSVNWILEELNADGSVRTPHLNTQSNKNYAYHHTISDTDILHTYRITADFSGGITKQKTFQIQAYTTPITQTMPTGAKKGVNYNFPNIGEVTFVLHTPTRTQYKYYDSNNCVGTTSTASTAPKKVIHLIGDFNNWQISDAFSLKKDGDYWWITLDTASLSPVQNEYVYQYLVDGAIRIGDPYAHKVSDPDDQYISASIYPNLIAYPQGKTTGRASVLELNKEVYHWQVPTFVRTKERNELNVYELHFRDFTPEGTYKAAIAKLDYLKDLGITCIHVMPVSEFEGNDSWGYNPNYYFAADKAYGTENDLKEFIDQAHKRGIAVVNDLVLNHAFYSNPNAMLYWDKQHNRPAADNPWFNAEHKGVYDQAGHWGADWNHASEHTRQMVDDIIHYWMDEFKFDGFRFDFTKGFTQKNPNPSDPWASNYDNCRIEILKNMAQMVWKNTAGVGKAPYVIFEHLANDSEDKALADSGILMWSGAGPQNSYMEMAMGYHQLSFMGSVYSSRGFANANYMSYIESHDEERIGYKVKMWGKDKPTDPDAYANYFSNRTKLAAAFNMLLPGPRMVWQFGELGYDISIDENGRTGRKPNAWNLNYHTQEERQEIYRLYALMFRLRNTYNLYEDVDYRNIGSTTEWQRTFSLKDTTRNIQVIAVGNFDTTNTHQVVPDYSQVGMWFKYNGDPTIDGMPFVVSTTADSYTLPVTDPVYILTNADMIAPKISPKTIEISTEYTNGYMISDTSYDFQQETFSNISATPAQGFASDNSDKVHLYVVSINGTAVTETFTLNGQTVTGIRTLKQQKLPLGENKIRWVAMDNFSNRAETTQTIKVILVPDARVSAVTPRICPSATATFEISGTPASKVTYTLNGIADMKTLSSEGKVIVSVAATTRQELILTGISHPLATQQQRLLTRSAVIEVISVDAPTISVDNQCGKTILTASNYTGALKWSTGETTATIEVTQSGNYSVSQKIGNCESTPATQLVTIQSVPIAPTISVDNQCGKTLLTASNYTGALKWSTGETTATIEVRQGGTYSVSQKIGDCESAPATQLVTIQSVPIAPTVSVDNQFGKTILTATNYTGALKWSTGETTATIEVTQNGTYSVSQKIGDCESPEASEQIFIKEKENTTNNELVFYNAISANGDGVNDILQIQGVENYPNNTIKIFNELGQLVFQMQGYNNRDKVFRGYANVGSGGRLPSHTYFYVFEYIDQQGNIQRKMHWLYLK
ncbi:alpha-amylase family glycosyl hydrolase [Capnocytophaga catalasegens]|uniref:alpha-amylase family glycosyl hydrolase n=1 Tax=Capnocytophaga catalasegens TaxID=1004260 RepID=UPI002232A30D|nr:alpha-amylase family glycosyl hydrolase [Capnocytophaga catalasegens]GIZ14991.1 hypothetical protein RCZ03_09910 [Capnocytophaga catalasegens]